MSKTGLSSKSSEGSDLIEIELPKEIAETLGHYAGKKGETIEERITKVIIQHVQRLQASDDVKRWVDKGYSRITDIVPLDIFSLHVKFDDGLEGDFDIVPIIGRGGKFYELGQFEVFSQVEIALDGETLLWPNGTEVEARTIYWTIYYQQKSKL